LPQVSLQGQGGLFDLALHPQYSQNGWIYWAFNAQGPGGWGTALARGKLKGLRMTEVQLLFSMQPKTRSGQHFGGRIVFDKAGMLYLTLGDRGDKERAQNGTIMRARSSVCTTMGACPSTIHLPIGLRHCTPGPASCGPMSTVRKAVMRSM
jgi:glucose/arabinose dehydrogenase